MKTKKGYCSECKEIVEAMALSTCSSLFCPNHKRPIILTRKPKEKK